MNRIAYGGMRPENRDAWVCVCAPGDLLHATLARSPSMAVRILIADDDPAIRRLLRRLIENHDDWSVCGDAGTGESAIAMASRLNPDVVVLDLAMPQMNGLQAAREISHTAPETPMLLLTVQEVSKELTREAIHAGFKGAVSKDTGSEVIKAIELLLKDQVFFQSMPQDVFVR